MLSAFVVEDRRGVAPDGARRLLGRASPMGAQLAETRGEVGAGGDRRRHVLVFFDALCWRLCFPSFPVRVSCFAELSTMDSSRARFIAASSRALSRSALRLIRFHSFSSINAGE